MSVYIKGMEMPTSCFFCRFSGLGGLRNERVVCMFTGANAYMNTVQYLDDCPLVPVPEHGRLIDADALPYTRLYKDNWLKGTGREAPAVWKEDVDSAPTVIPADEEAEK